MVPAHIYTAFGVLGGLVCSVAAASDDHLTKIEYGSDSPGHAGQNNATCTFSGSDGHLLVKRAKRVCSTIVLDSLRVPGNVTLNLENLRDGTNVIFKGRTTWDFAAWNGSLFSVSGNNITVTGAPGSVLDGQGELWWDGFGSGKNSTVLKPKFFKANKLTNSLLDSIHILNAPIHGFSINHVSNVTLRNTIVNNTAGEVRTATNVTRGHNTDAFDINNCDGVFITGAQVWNQDDCVAINSGRNVVFRDGFCSGGHGISIGSVGGREHNDVRNVTFENVVMEKSQQSVRIKTISGANGTVDGITYRNISVSQGTSFGIIISQSYNGVFGMPTNGVNITNVVLDNVKGAVNASAVNVYIECGQGSCRDWKWKDVSITGGQTSANCTNVPEGARAYCANCESPTTAASSAGYLGRPVPSLAFLLAPLTLLALLHLLHR